MADIEKVIKALEICLNDVKYDCIGCPYYGPSFQCKQMKSDALELLKEQEQEIQFLKAMQLQTVNNMNEEDLGTAVAKILGLKGR